MPFSYTGAVNLNTTEHQLEFSGNFIYLGAKGNKLLTKPEPVPYNPDALLTYISYDTVEGTLVTADWSDSPKENDIIVFVVDCKYPERSYGYFPFKVDGRMRLAIIRCPARCSGINRWTDRNSWMLPLQRINSQMPV